MHVGWVSKLRRVSGGGGLDPDLLARRVEGRLHLVPRFRQRIVQTPLGEPFWADDPGFRIERHVHVPEEPTQPLAQLTESFLSRPLDRSRPLWEIQVVPRIRGGGAAVLGKVHHAMVDGVAAVELGMLLFDIAPEAALPDRVDWEPAPPASGVRLAAESAGDTALEQFRAARRIAGLGLNPRRTARVAESMRRAALSLAEDAVRPAPASYLNPPIDGRRALATGEIPLARLRSLKDAAGVKLNDLVLALAATALRRLAAIREEPADPVRAMVPVSVRSEGETGSGGNRIAFAFVDLPVEEPEPLRRLALVQQRMDEVKASGRTAGSDLLMRAVVGQLPGPLKDRAARLAAGPRLYNLTVSNVPGPQRPLYAAGMRVESIHPVIPLSDGHALAIGVLSYDGSLQLAAHLHPGALPEAAGLPGLVRSALGELEAAMRPRQRRARLPGPRRSLRVARAAGAG